MDPYADFRFRLFPVRCGSPGACFRLISNYQDRVESLLDTGAEWDDIFSQLGITRKCCQSSIRNFSWYYDRAEFSKNYTRNCMTSDNAVWSTSFSEPSSYPIHSRVYQLDAVKGPVFIGYTSNAVKNIKDIDEDIDEYNIVNDEADILQEKHIKAISALIDDRILRYR